MMISCRYSIVEFIRDTKGRRCGYCKSKNTYYSNGMWAYRMDVREYQSLIDRGWRRSGQHCYKPTMNLTCCPMYTIQCKVEEFKLSKSQKKVLKKMNNFLKNGGKTSENDSGTVDDGSSFIGGHICADKLPVDFEKKQNLEVDPSSSDILMDASPSSSYKPDNWKEKTDECITMKDKDCVMVPHISAGKTGPCNEEVIAASQCPRKKAKLIRLENKYKKLVNKGLSEAEAKEVTYQGKKKPLERKELEDFIDASSNESSKHKLEVKLVRTKPPSSEYLETNNQSYLLYKKYQIIVHGDDPESITTRQYTQFLVHSPLQPYIPEEGPPEGYGSFHQQYWLDGNLVAVGVIDILPNCVSSVYFYYDPDLRDLTLGTYGSLREIALTRHLCKLCPNLKYYYMGFYIHSCPKMSYKAQYSPSRLLCPETYTWHPIEKCLPKLDKSKYSILEENKSTLDENGIFDVNKVLTFQGNDVLPYSLYKTRNPGMNDEEEVQEYANLVGLICTQQLLLVRM